MNFRPVDEDTLRRVVRNLINSWLDSVFGPLYHFTYRIKLSTFQDKPPEVLLMEHPKLLFDATVKMFDSELVASSFLCTFLKYCSKLCVDEVPQCGSFIEWFKNNDKESVNSFIQRCAQSKLQFHRF